MVQLLGLGLTPSDPNQQIALLAARAAILSAVAAIAATVLAPAIAYYTSRTQIRANLVSANRQAWINALRDDLAELFELFTFLFLLRAGTFGGDQGVRLMMDKRSKIRLLTNRIRLRLNPKEEPSKLLLEAIDSLARVPHGTAVSGEAEALFNQWMEAAVAAAQTILKSEWKRVKKGQ
jgi:hypothetical protein